MELVWRSALGSWPQCWCVDRSGGILAWSGAWEPEPFVHLVDADTGSELHRELCATTGFVAAGPGIFAEDHGWREPGGGSHERRRLVCLRSSSGNVVAIWRDLPSGTHVIGVDPTGDRLLLFGAGRALLCSWPELAELAAWDGYQHGVDWTGGYRWSRRAAAPLVVSALDRSWARVVDLAAPRVLDTPPDASDLARARDRARMRVVWHPTRDLVALQRRRRRRTVIMTTQGIPVCRLPDRSWPVAWLGDDAIVIARHTGPAVHLERWQLLPGWH